MIIGCNIWMICMELNRFFTVRVEYCNFLKLYVRYVLHAAWVVFNNFLLIDATDRSKISSESTALVFHEHLIKSFTTRQSCLIGLKQIYIHTEWSVWQNNIMEVYKTTYWRCTKRQCSVSGCCTLYTMHILPIISDIIYDEKWV